MEFWGSDVRIPEIASADNPYSAKMYREYPELSNGAHERSIQTQMRFSRYGFECLLPGAEIYPYISESIFPTPYHTKARLIILYFIPKYPDPDKKRPVIVHAPSDKAKKGTKAVSWAIDHLKKKYGTKIPILKLDDPISRFYNYKKGDIIEITRYDNNICHRMIKL